MGQIRIGSRESRLAVVQAEKVMDMLGGGELVTMKTSGDMILDKTLDKAGGKGLFVRELDEALRTGRVDLTVHSLKDVPAELPEGLPILAYTMREDPRDVLVLPEHGNWDKTKPIGCSSLRRKIQLKMLFHDTEVKPVRGNVQTRLRKLEEGEYGALVLAAAGLHRLGLESRIYKYFTPEEMIPAAGQGILAVQGREGEFSEEAAKLDDEESRICAICERAYVRTLGAGCFAPIAAYAEVQGELMCLRGMYATNDEKFVIRGTATGKKGSAEDIGRSLALHLKQKAEVRG